MEEGKTYAGEGETQSISLPLDPVTLDYTTTHLTTATVSIRLEGCNQANN